ncbi:CHASE2 domain-containing protein [Limnoraphis robusta]|uniref:CHASE2 domain-containing protein n=1 Tax=Limnoraphis robusta TaxID=1118279 RepID=UPI002B1FA12F|nr:CHASE2 domain-containing protein [Limnoraphis robusta]MEA5497914.1 CHASE2 domain-containing protein [Limnoraphis robusta BA-68 BA1]
MPSLTSSISRSKSVENGSKSVVLNFGNGNTQHGCSMIVANLWTSASFPPIRLTGSLPPALELAQLYKRWRSLFEALNHRLSWRRGVVDLAIEFDEQDIAQVSQVEFLELSRQLKQSLNQWLDSGSFGRIERRLRTQLSPHEEIRVIIETDDPVMRRLPWHLWNFFEDYPASEVGLSSTLEAERIEPTHRSPGGTVRILAILGNSHGIDIEQDRALLEHLPGAKTVFLVEPRRSELNRLLWDEEGWDILFFAGHSSSHISGATGFININHNEAITVIELKFALQAAIARGLQLALFNSCDGLGLARQLADLQIPQLVVMREPVPDQVAQAFLKHWLSAFSTGTSFYRSVREAREKLQDLEPEYPCACWLPVICQNPTVIPPTWLELRGNRQLPAHSIAAFGAIVTVLVIALRSLGLMQGWELKAYDQLLRLRPFEEVDSRVLVVEATEKDIQKYGGFPLPDRTLVKLIEKLKSYQPRVMGIDIYRDVPREPGHAQLLKQLTENQNLIAVCSASESRNLNKPGVAPPPNIPKNRLGFTDVVVDSDDILRRHLLFMNPDSNSPCQTELSLSFQLAQNYLRVEGITPQLRADESVQMGDVVFKPLAKPSGGYQKFDNRGFQLLLNYRAIDQHQLQRVTFSQILEGEVDPDSIKDRLVLIGISAPISTDYFSTPYSFRSTEHQKMPGVVLQAQMISQILSSVLDGRPLIWVWSQWGDWVWIGSWSIVGGIIAWHHHRFSSWTPVVGVAVVTLSGICYIFLLWGGWVPIVPSSLTLVITAVCPFLLKNQ